MGQYSTRQWAWIFQKEKKMVWWFEIKGDWKDVITKYDTWLDDLGLEKTPNPAILGAAEKI